MRYFEDITPYYKTTTKYLQNANINSPTTSTRNSKITQYVVFKDLGILWFFGESFLGNDVGILEVFGGSFRIWGYIFKITHKKS